MINITFDLTSPIEIQLESFKKVKDFLESEGISVGLVQNVRVPRPANIPALAGPIEKWYIQERKLTRMKVTDSSITREEFATRMCEKHGIIIPAAMLEESKKWEEDAKSPGNLDSDESDEDGEINAFV